MATINNIEIDGINYELGGLSSIPVVNQTDVNVTIKPNVLNVWGEMLYINIDLEQAEDDTIVNEYMIQFRSGDIETSLTLPENIQWIYDPLIKSNAVYQISILNNYAILGEFADKTVESIPYVKVEYLQSDSNAFIDTGLSLDDDNVDIYVEFEWNSYTQYGAVYGNYVSTPTNTNCYRLLLNSSTQFLNSHNTLSNETGNGYFNCDINNIHKLFISKNSFILDNISIPRTGVAKGETNTSNIALFNRSVMEPISRNIDLKVYAFTVLKEGVKLLNFIPVVVDGVGYMYDTVSKKLFGNVGTGNFVIGPEI